MDSSFSGPGYGSVTGSVIITRNEAYHTLDHMIQKDT